MPAAASSSAVVSELGCSDTLRCARRSCWTRLQQRGYCGRAETALRMMVLGDDDPAARGTHGLDHHVGVDRLDRVEVDKACVDPVEGQLIG